MCVVFRKCNCALAGAVCKLTASLNRLTEGSRLNSRWGSWMMTWFQASVVWGDVGDVEIFLSLLWQCIMWESLENVSYVSYESFIISFVWGGISREVSIWQITSDVHESVLNIPITKPSEAFELSTHSHQPIHSRVYALAEVPRQAHFRIVEEAIVHDIMTKMKITSTSTFSSSLFQFFSPKPF